MLNSFETTRLLIKQLHKESADLVLRFYEENKAAFEAWEPKRANLFYSLPYQKASLSAEYHQMLEGKLIRYWVFLKEHPEEIIGSFCFQNFLRGPYHSCSLGYKFSEKHQHRGYALESIAKGLELIFEELPVHRVEAYIMPNNQPSIHLIEKLNFVFEGISYSYANIDGTWSDHLRYSYINPRDIRTEISPFS